MAERFFLTCYDEQENGDLIRASTVEVSHYDILRMNGIDPTEFWALPEAMQEKVIAEIWSGFDPTETMADAQAAPKVVN